MDRKRFRKGNAFVTVVSFGTALAVGAAAVDVAQLKRARGQVRSAVDAAALSADLELNGTVAGIDRAVTRAVEIASMNRAANAPVGVTRSDVVVGWYSRNGDFVPWSGDEHDAKKVDTVKLINQPHAVLTTLSGLAFGQGTFNLSLPSGATRPYEGAGARSTPCFLPIAVPDCWIANLPPGQNPTLFKFMFQSSSLKNIAWTRPDHSPSMSEVREQLTNQCGGGSIGIGQQLYVNEGVHQAALEEVIDVLNGESTLLAADTWDTDKYGPLPPRDGGQYTANTPTESAVLGPRWGRTIEGPVPLIDVGPSCDNIDFTGPKPIKRFGWGVVYDVDRNGERNIYVKLDAVADHVVWGDADPTVNSNVKTRSTATLVIQ